MAIDGAVAMFNENAGVVYNAREYRRFFEKIAGYDLVTSPGTGSGGIMRPPDLFVHENSTPSLIMRIDAGAAMVDGSEASTQGAYFVYNDAVVNVTHAAGDASNPRVDLVGIQIRDTEYSGGTNDARLVIVQGTPAASPSEPTKPANFVTLARVDVPANDTVITNSQVTDRRRMMSMLGGIAIASSGALPTTNLWEGLFVYQPDAHKLMQYTTSTTGWTPPWNVAWGSLAAPATRTVTQASLGVLSDLTGLSLAVTRVSNRNVLVHGVGYFVATGGAGKSRLLTREATTTLGANGYFNHNAATDYGIIDGWVALASSATGSHTYKLSGGKNAFDVDFAPTAAGTEPGVSYIDVVDMGPVGAPA